MPNLPKKLVGNSPYAIAFNQLLDFFTSLRPAQGVGVLTQHTVSGVIRTPRPLILGRASNGWDWASPPGYDQSNDYKPGKAVIVDSDNDAVTDGVNSGADFAEVGIFLCVNPVSGADPSDIKPPKKEPDPAVDGGGKWLDTVYWVALGGGGGGGLKQYRYKSMSGDYLVCRTYDGTTEGVTDEKVAKPYRLRHLGSSTLRGDVVTYSAYDDSDQTRVATDSMGSETQGITEEYEADNLLYVAAVDHTGVTVSGVELKLIDVNACGRAWAKLSS